MACSTSTLNILERERERESSFAESEERAPLDDHAHTPNSRNTELEESLASPDADTLAFLLETSAMEPDPEVYDFLGYLQPPGLEIWVHDVDPAPSVDALLESHDILRVDPENPHSGDRGLLFSADGRLFIEKEWVVAERLATLDSMPASGSSELGEGAQGNQPPDEQPVPVELAQEPTNAAATSRSSPGQAAHGTDALASPPDPMGDTIHGSDNRTATKSDQWPLRAMGVALLRRTSTSPLQYARNKGSASMVGPRHAITAAHTFSDTGSGISDVLGVAPAIRGTNYGNDNNPTWTSCSYTPKAPFGIRPVQWYYWPNGWDGSGIKYDYAMLILQDCSYYPGWIQFGWEYATWLDYRDMFMVGYPSTGKSCADDYYTGNGKCGGYMYYQIENTNAVGTNYMYSDFDVQEGQSGAPIIYDHDGPHIVYGIHKGSEGPYTYGLRFNSSRYSALCSWLQNWSSVAADNPDC